MPHKDPEARARANREAKRRQRAKRRAKQDVEETPAPSPDLRLVSPSVIDTAPIGSLDIPDSLFGDHPRQADVSKMGALFLQRLFASPGREMDRIRVGITILRLMSEVSKDIQVATDDQALKDRLDRLEELLVTE